ncbi:hypothetical protein [Chitinimonas sp. BJYL2]|uniref:hypothetical protein n=1 Tax=Chitinimonas sp. BJYL2 TaxID=2976696 RepID=UPI0022B52265|nr:hypothetical protein [Chitinimonas sp. BJYL2]
MKKSQISLASLIATAAIGIVSVEATAVTACAGTATSVTVSGSTASFVKNDFSLKCSANVLMDYSQDAVTAGVCAGSIKGKNKFGGTTAGGAVSAATTTCGTDGCTTTEVASNLTTGC